MKRRWEKGALAGTLFFAVCVLSGAALAEPRPLWELGGGATAFRLPDYRGSAESRNYVYPIPYVVYRGNLLKVDRQGARAVLLDANRFEVDLSASGTPPVDSTKNKAREGMPGLDPTLEIGPQVNYHLARSDEQEWRLTFRAPLRAVIASDLKHTRQAGYIFSPHLALNMRPSLAGGKWNVGLQAGPLFATRDYHRYFYGVDPQFATADRPAYEARGGYSGAFGLVGATRRVGKLWVGGFMRYDTLRGAAFENSPLVKRDNSFMAGIAFAWVFAESERMVEAKE